VSTLQPVSVLGSHALTMFLDLANSPRMDWVELGEAVYEAQGHEHLKIAYESHMILQVGQLMVP
jgi:hypothetical protein